MSADGGDSDGEVEVGRERGSERIRSNRSRKERKEL